MPCYMWNKIVSWLFQRIIAVHDYFSECSMSLTYILRNDFRTLSAAEIILFQFIKLGYMWNKTLKWFQNYFKIVIRPPDIVCRRTYILPVFLLLLLLLLLSLFFRPLISEVAKRNSTKIGHMVGSKCNLKTHVRNLGYPSPYKSGAQKPPFLDDFAI